MKRRPGVFVVVLVLALLTIPLAAPVAAQTQPRATPRRIGFLGNSTASLEPNLVGPFRDGRDLGYVEGRDPWSSTGGRRGSTTASPPSSPSCSP